MLPDGKLKMIDFGLACPRGVENMLSVEAFSSEVEDMGITLKAADFSDI